MKKGNFFHLRPLKGCRQPPFFSQHTESAKPYGFALNNEDTTSSTRSASPGFLSRFTFKAYHQ
jgi:hypothetical protein